MKQEFDWQKISEITAKRGVCIRPDGVNHQKAKEDFSNPKVNYYTFFYGKGIGYMRTITEQERIFVDFMSPWGSGIGEVVLLRFAKQQVLPVYINENNAPDKFKTAEAEKIPQVNIGEGIAQRVYTNTD